MRASSRVLMTTACATAALSLMIGIAYAQGLPSLGSTAGMMAPIQRFLKILADPWVMLFVLFSGLWSLFYFVYRIGFEKSGQVPKPYVHKLAMVLSLLSMAPLLWWIANSVDAKAELKVMLGSAAGWAFALAVFCLFTMAYWIGRRLFHPAGTT